MIKKTLLLCVGNVCNCTMVQARVSEANFVGLVLFCAPLFGFQELN